MAHRLHDLPARWAASDPDTIALWWDGLPTTFGQLWARVERLAGRLAATGRPASTPYRRTVSRIGTTDFTPPGSS